MGWRIRAFFLSHNHNYIQCFILFFSDLESTIQGTQYVSNDVSKSEKFTSQTAFDIKHNGISPLTESKSSKVGNYKSNVTSNFTQNAIIGNDKKSDNASSRNFIEKKDSHTVHIHTVSNKATVANSHPVQHIKDTQELTVKCEIEGQLREKSTKVKKAPAAPADGDELIAFTEESLKVFENSGLSKEENKIIAALDDTISGYVNAAFDDGNDPLDGEKHVDEGVFDLSDKNESKSSSRSSSVSNKSDSDKPGIIARKRESSAKEEKRSRPSSVSFKLPENHVDKQTNGKFNTRTLPASARGKGYKRVLSFYSYRPNNNPWATQDFARHHSDKDLHPKHVIPKAKGSVSKKSIGPFNAAFTEFIRGKLKTEEKVKPTQSAASRIQPDDVKPNLPIHTRKRATILDRDTTELIPKKEVNGEQHSEFMHKLNNKPYIVQENGKSAAKGDSSELGKGDKFLY